MVDKIICPRCNRENDIQNFCIFCGERLPDGEHVNPDPNIKADDLKMGNSNVEIIHQSSSQTVRVSNQFDDVVQNSISWEVNSVNQSSNNNAVINFNTYSDGSNEEYQSSGGYCDDGCRYFEEIFLDSNGDPTRNLTGGENIIYWCNLGGCYVSPGDFCDDYE